MIVKIAQSSTRRWSERNRVRRGARRVARGCGRRERAKVRNVRPGKGASWEKGGREDAPVARGRRRRDWVRERKAGSRRGR